MKKKTMAGWITFAIIIFTFIFLSVRFKKTETADYKIGAVFPLTGSLAFLGIPEQVAAQVAVDEINKVAGREKIRLIVEDSKSQAKDAVAAAQKLINVVGIELGLASTSALANAVAPIFHEKGVPLITFCSDETIPQNYDNVLNIYVNLDNEQQTMARYLLEKGITSISALRVNAQITERGIELLKKHSNGKLEVVNNETYELTATDYRSLITKLKNDKSQAIYLMGYGVEFPAIVKTMRELDVQKKIFGNYMFLTSAAQQEGLEIYENIKFTAFPITPEEIGDTDFGRRFEWVYGDKPGPFLDYLYVYEAIRIWHETIVQKGVKPQEFPNYLRNRAFQTLMGEIKIDSTGNATGPMSIATYTSEGKVELIWMGE